MATLADIRAGTILKEDLNELDRATIRQELIDERANAQLAETRAAERTSASAERQRGLNEQVGPRQPAPIRGADTGRFSGPVEPLDDAGRAAASAARADDTRTATGLDRNATTQFRPISPEANAAAAADRARGPGSESATRRASVGGTGFTGSQTGDLESRPGAIERGLRAVGATDAADRRAAARTGAREELITQPATARPAGGELDVEDRPLSNAQQKEVDSLQADVDTAQERKRRNQRTVNTSQNPAKVTAAKTAIAEADKAIAAATTQQAAVNAQARTPTPAGDVVEGARRVAADPVGAADDLANKTKEVLAEATTAVKDSAKNPTGRLNKIADAVKEKAAAAVQGGRDLAGRVSPSRNIPQEAQDLSTKMKNNAKRVVKLGLGVELANAADDFGVRVSQVGFDQAADEVADGAVQSMSDAMTRINQDENLNERSAGGKIAQGGIEFGNAMIDMVRGMATTFGADVPQKLIDLTADFADMVGVPFTDLRFERGTGFNFEQYVKPEGFSGFEGRTFQPGVDAQPFELGTSAGEGLRDVAPVAQPGTPAFTGPADPGALPGRPGERFDPTGTQPSQAPVTQAPFLSPGDGTNLNIRGLRDGTGTIDVAGATGGPSGFAQRVEESRRAGAFEPVSQARRDEAQEDLGRVRRGTDAIRSLSASRLGVPVQFLDAVRSGAMTPREANLAQAKQAASGNAGGLGLRDQQALQIAANQENRAATEFAGEQTDAAIERFRNTGDEVANSFPGKDDAGKDAIASGFQTFASGWLPQGIDPAQLTSTDLQQVKGQYLLATALAEQGEGWLRALNPFAPDITANTLIGRGENILRSMERQGEWFDIGNDNLRFEGRDSSGDNVTLTVETEDLPPEAQNMVRQFRDQLRGERGLR